VICTPEGKEVDLAVVSAGSGFDKEVNSFELSIACASLPFTLCTTWLRFMASSTERWLPKCFTSLEPLVVTLPAIVEESHWLLDSVGACSTLTG